MVFWRKIFGRVVKIAISVARESFLMKTISDKKNCNSILFGLWETLSYFWRQSYGSLVKISFYVFRRTFWGKIGFFEILFFSSFPEFEQKVSRVLRGIFWQGCHNCILHVHRNYFRKVIFLSKSSKFFFVVFGIWAANVWTLREKYLLPLSGLHSPLLKNHFWWKK